MGWGRGPVRGASAPHPKGFWVSIASLRPPGFSSRGPPLGHPHSPSPGSTSLKSLSRPLLGGKRPGRGRPGEIHTPSPKSVIAPFRAEQERTLCPRPAARPPGPPPPPPGSEGPAGHAPSAAAHSALPGAASGSPATHSYQTRLAPLHSLSHPVPGGP